MDEIPIIIEKKKRGRKPNSEKLKMSNLEKDNIIINNVDGLGVSDGVENNISEIKVPKKRGRKPKGGKIIEASKIIDNKINLEPNVILHLKCNISWGPDFL